MTTIKSIIIDDEINARENIRGILEKHCPRIEIMAEATSAIEAINQIEQLNPDLIFLDIEMPSGNGFKVLEYFQQPSFRVIFVTAYDQYAIQAIRFAALDYILKPINALLLKAAITRYIEQEKQMDKRLETFLNNNKASLEDKKIALPSSNKIKFVAIKNIVRLQSEANYTLFCLDNKEQILISKPLIEYEEILYNFGFIRTHKSHLVNTIHIGFYVKTEGGYLTMSDGSSVPIARRKKEMVLDQLKKL